MKNLNKPHQSPSSKKASSLKSFAMATLISLGTVLGGQAQGQSTSSTTKIPQKNIPTIVQKDGSTIVNTIGDTLNIPTNSALGIVRANVKKEFPSMASHFDSCIAALYVQEEVDEVNTLLQQHIISQIQDTKEQTGWAFVSLEYILKGKKIPSKFSNWVGWKQADDNNTSHKIDFVKGYVEWFKVNKTTILAKVEKENQRLKEEITKNKEEITKNKEKINKNKEEYIERMKRFEESISLGKISNKEVFSMMPSIKQDGQIFGIKIEKDFPLVWKKIQEVENMNKNLTLNTN